MSFTNQVDLDKLRPALFAKVGQTKLQYQRGAGAETLKVVAAEGKGGSVTNALLTSFPEAGFKVIGNDSVGPSVGKEIRNPPSSPLLVPLRHFVLRRLPL